MQAQGMTPEQMQMVDIQRKLYSFRSEKDSLAWRVVYQTRILDRKTQKMVDQTDAQGQPVLEEATVVCNDQNLESLFQKYHCESRRIRMLMCLGMGEYFGEMRIEAVDKPAVPAPTIDGKPPSPIIEVK